MRTFIALGALLAMIVNQVTAAGECEVATEGATCPICKPGGVGVGTTTLCNSAGQIGGFGENFPDCGGQFGTIFRDDCNSAAISWDSNFCNGVHLTDSSWTVYCEGDGGAVNEVAHTLDDGSWDFYGNCAPPTGTDYCRYEVLLSRTYNNVEYCCDFSANLKM